MTDTDKFIARVAAPIVKFRWQIYWFFCIAIPIFSGLFSIDKIDCRSCFKDVFLHSLAFFGYILLTGYLFSCRDPELNGTTQEKISDFRLIWFWCAVGLALMSAVGAYK